MGKITISADTPEEVFAIAERICYGAPASGEAPSPTSEAPKSTRTRKKAEAPPPMQPNGPDTSASAPPPPPPPQGNPFGQPEQPAQGFAPPPPPPPGFDPAAGNPHANAHAERPIVTQVKDMLTKLSNQHGEPQVYAWAIQKAFGLSPSLSKEDFLSNVIHQQSDAMLESVLRQGGGGK